jgi:SpoIIAA-like
LTGRSVGAAYPYWADRSDVVLSDFGLLHQDALRRDDDDTTVKEGTVIEILTGFPDNVSAFALHGHVTKTDYDTLLIPDLEGKLGRHKKVRLYCEIAPDYVGIDPGAVWEDTKLGFSHLFDWDRAVMVTDVEWMKQAVKFFGGVFGFLAPVGEWYVFPLAEADRAREWIVGGGPAARM